MRYTSSLLAVVASFLLVSCVDKESRVTSNLIEFGFSDSVARCMARPLAQDLSIAQLQRLGALAKAFKASDQPRGTQRVLERLAGIGDPEIIGVVGQATLGCMFAG